MNLQNLSRLAVILALALSCKNNNPTSDSTRSTAQSTRTAAPPAVVAPPSVANMERLEIDPATSSVGFVGSKVTGRHEGRFTNFSGGVFINPDGTPDVVDLTLQMDSLVIEPVRLATHLRSNEFFDVARFPTARFQSRSPTVFTENGATHRFVGELTLHGVTHEVSIPATVTITPTDAHAVATFTINRRDWGVIYPGMANDLIRDEVEIHFDVHFPRRPR